MMNLESAKSHLSTVQQQQQQKKRGGSRRQKKKREGRLCLESAPCLILLGL